ncbi:MAG: SRPBCC family protein [Candidatus Dormibacteraeota bacterium]|nr:SRPBCC family protein [Candidatus Dormibacteraeota bacterium]
MPTLNHTAQKEESQLPQASSETTIARPRGEVFAYLADAEHDGEWRPGVIEVTRVSGDGVGTRYRQIVSGPRGRRIDADIEITEYQPDRRLAFRTVTGPVRPSGSYDLDDVHGHTRVRFRLTAELNGLKKLLMPMVRKTMATEVRNLDNLKKRLEAQQ